MPTAPRLAPHPVVSLALATALAACGGDDGGGGLTCERVPACATEALAALRACVASPALALGTVTASSGVISGLTCTGGDVVVELSPFSASATGTVPVPSTVTLRVGGAVCAELGAGTGSITDGGGATRTYTTSTITAGGAEVTIARFADGAIGVSCDDADVEAAAGALAGCPAAFASHEVVRDADVTRIGVDLLDAAGARAALFVCE